MSDASHSRTMSQDTVSSTRSSTQAMVERLLSFAGSNELPLRTMYTFNCAPRAQPLPKLCRSGSPTFNKINMTSPIPGCNAKVSQSLISQLSQLPAQPLSLPPTFILDFVRKCFRGDYYLINFPLSLTALDYLRDLEFRRRKEMAAVLTRLGIERDSEVVDSSDILLKHPEAAQWIESIEEKENNIDALYSQLYIGLRRWLLIHELSMTPFCKHNCVAMLNTLYPPVISPPSCRLSLKILKAQRDGFFRYIQGVEKNGPRILNNVKRQGKREQDVDGWLAVHITLECYLAMATKMIDDCQLISGIEDFESTEEKSKRNGRKIDSGVSFNSTNRPSTSGSAASNINKALPPSPGKKYRSLNMSIRFERLADGLKKMGKRHKVEVEEIVKYSETGQQKAPKDKHLRKIQSVGAFRDFEHANHSVTTLDMRKGSDFSIPEFNEAEMKHHRELYEANSAIVKG